MQLVVGWRNADGDGSVSTALPGDGTSGQAFEVCASGHGSVWRRPAVTVDQEADTDAARQGKVVLFDVQYRRSWLEYYQFYARRDRYGVDDYDVIVKCDDDIVYVDVDKFPAFVAKRCAYTQPMLLFASIVNNGMAAWYQQQAGILPRDVFVATYEPKGFCKLWSHATHAAALHAWLLDSNAPPRADLVVLHPIDHRVSVNFFAVLGRDLKAVYGAVGEDDERDLTQLLPGVLGRPVAFDLGMVVAHLSFDRQRATGLDEPSLVARYEGAAAALVEGARSAQ